jgi:hypothetical protein
LHRFPADLSYCLHQLIGLGCVEVDYGGWLSAMGDAGPQVVLEGDPAPDASFGLGPCFPSMLVKALILQQPAETLDEDVVQVSGFAVHGYFDLGPPRSKMPAAPSKSAFFH